MKKKYIFDMHFYIIQFPDPEDHNEIEKRGVRGEAFNYMGHTWYLRWKKYKKTWNLIGPVSGCIAIERKNKAELIIALSHIFYEEKPAEKLLKSYRDSINELRDNGIKLPVNDVPIEKLYFWKYIDIGEK